MAYSNKIAEILSMASETDKVEFAHFLSNNLDTGDQSRDDARVRDYVAAFDRFAAPKQGEHF